MTIAATGIGRWPAHPRPHQETCRHCGTLFVGAPGMRYCRRDVCQAAKVRREREKQRRRGK